MMWVGTVASLAVLWILGAFTLAALGARPLDGVHAVATDFATGAAVLAGLGMAVIVLGFSLSLATFYALILALAGVVMRQRSLRPMRFILPDAPAANAALVCTALIIAFIVIASLHDRLWWDGWAIWTLKGRALFLDGTLPRALFSGGYAFTHPGYPLAVPLVDWWSWRHAGMSTPATASFIGAMWFALLPALLWSGLRRRAGERIAALATLGMALFWPIPFYATGGTADVVIAVALLGAIVELDTALSLDDDRALTRCALFLTLGALAKNEGLAIAGVVVAMAVAAMLRQGELRVRRIAPLVAPFAAIAPWWVFVGTLDARETVLAPASLSVLGERIPVVVQHLGALATSIPWLPLPLLAALGVTAALRGSRNTLTGWLILWGYFCVVAGVYLLTPHDIVWLLSTSLARVLSVFVAPLVYLSVVSVHHVRTPGPA